MTRLSAIAIGLSLMLVGMPAGAAAQQPDTHDRTIMTFSAAVELPGMKLEPGTYVFRLADTASRNVIQVLSQDEMQVLGQWLYVSAERREVTGDTVVTFREASANTTPAIQFWFYPGEKIGKEFMYPKDQGERIAQRTGVSVLTEDGRVEPNEQTVATAERAPSSDAAGSNIGIVEGSGLPEEPAETAANRETASNQRDEPTPQQGAVAVRSQEERPVGTSGQAESTTAQNAELPATSSPLAIGGVLGLLSILGAAGIRLFRS
ncbi:MAG TPA: hypothetical protein VHJ58_18810 [Vicinamibacterales bacterium]|nr:hypothetical protein [Vicinamibacterales bacterium]